VIGELVYRTVKRLSAAVLLTGTVALGGIAVAAPADAQSGDATVTVVHGVPGVTVDVCANGSAAIKGFTYKSTKTLSLPAGSYSLGVVKTGAACSASNELATATASLTAGENASVVAYMNSAGKPTLGLYGNDLAAVPSGDGRLVLSHNADAPTVSVSAGSTTLASSLAPGDQAAVVVPAKSYSGVDVKVASSGAAAISNATVPVTAGEDTIVYVVGTSSAGFSTIAQTVSLTSSGSGPGSIVTGNSPVGSSHPFSLPLLLGVLGLAAIGFSLSATAIIRRRRA
jgi:hypothetical protein